MPEPIFVLGKHRSGTTWLANQLCQHSLIAGVTHERHFGIHESAYFSCVYNRYGDLAERNNFVEFVEVIAASDYFRLAGATKEYLYSLWPTSYEEVFRAVMDNFAVRHGATFWVEKSPAHSIMVDKLVVVYPDARFIVVVRDVEAVVASTMALPNYGSAKGQLRQRLIVFTVLSWSLYNKTLKSYGARTDRMLTLRYETLRSDLADSLRRVCSFLELPFEPRMCDQGFVPNTSFQTVDRRRALSDNEKRLVRAVQRLIEILPHWALTSARRMTRNRRRQSLPWWFFKLHWFNSEDVQQLDESGNHQEIGANSEIVAQKRVY
jgi:hypothetical protein